MPARIWTDWNATCAITCAASPWRRPGDVVVLNLKSDDMFERSNLSDDGHDLLRNLSAALRHYDRTAVQVTGYTDTRGTPDKNLRSVAEARRCRGGRIARRRHRRASPDRDRHGPQRISRSRPATGVSEARNRRIEIRIVPKPG